MYYLAKYTSPLGEIYILSDTDSIVGLWFEGQKHFMLNYLKSEISLNNNIQVLTKAKKWLDDYFSKKRTCIFDLPIKPAGSDFKKAVWNVLCNIPYGKTICYSDIAKEIQKTQNKKTSNRAVGSAVARNPISIIIPCHRVIGKNGSLTGYAGGIDKKIKLLEHEQK